MQLWPLNQRTGFAGYVSHKNPESSVLVANRPEFVLR